jgi:hypothetical protein
MAAADFMIVPERRVSLVSESRRLYVQRYISFLNSVADLFAAVSFYSFCANSFCFAIKLDLMQHKT